MVRQPIAIQRRRRMRQVHHMKETSVPVEEIAAQKASAAVNRLRIKLTRKSSLRFKDLQIGAVLGQGGFCDVHEVNINQQAFALKRLRPESSGKRSAFINASVDLTTEAVLLTQLEHENIIGVHGMAAGPIERSVASEDGFFLVMEKIEYTLLDKMKEWKERRNTTATGRKNRLGQDELNERLAVALQLANALQYLQSQGVVHRDLKPENIGFDKNGVLKLFDFGLAVKTRPGKPYMSGVAGTRIYMAPEMAKHSSYDQSVDVYAFGLLLWEILSLERPFHGYNCRQLTTRVVNEGERPRVPVVWSRKLSQLIKKCWNSNPSKRPNMNEVVKSLESMM